MLTRSVRCLIAIPRQCTRRFRPAVALAAFSILAGSAACGGSPQGAAIGGSPQGAAVGGCTLNTVAPITTESSSERAAQTASWVVLNANGWTIPVPDSSWTVDGSPGGVGFDAISPDGQSDVSVGATYSQTPLSIAAMESSAFAQLSDMHTVCQTPVASSASGSTQGTEYTAVYNGADIHGIFIVSVLAPTTSGLWTGVTHSIYTPASQWSASAAQTLYLIAIQAIGTPQEP